MCRKIVCEIFKTPGKLQEKTAKAASTPVEVVADAGFYGLAKVTVDAIRLQEKSVEVQSEAQDVIADREFTALSRVTVAGYPTQEKAVTIKGSASIEPDAGFRAMTKVDVKVDAGPSYADFIDFLTYGGTSKVFKTELEEALIYGQPFVNIGEQKVDHFRIIDAPNIRATPDLSIRSYSPYYPGSTLQKIRCYNMPGGTFEQRSLYELREIYYTSDNDINFVYDENHYSWIQEFGAFQKLEKIIIPNDSLVTCSSVEGLLQIPAFTDGTGKIYVKDALVDAYKAATNWATVADYIHPISEYEAAGGWNYNFYPEEGATK